MPVAPPTGAEEAWDIAHEKQGHIGMSCAYVGYHDQGQFYPLSLIEHELDYGSSVIKDVLESITSVLVTTQSKEIPRSNRSEH